MNFYFPKLLAIVLYKFIYVPKRFYPKNNDEELISLALVKDLVVDNIRVKTFEWHSRGKVILILHGWNSYALSMRNIISSLVNNGYTVIAFDAPGHGLSKSKHSNTSYSNVISWFIKNYRPSIIIGHSIGAFYALMQLNTLKLDFCIERFIAIAMPNNIKYILDVNLDRFSNPKVKDKFYSIIKSKLDVYIEDVNLVKAYSQDPPFKCLLIHDRDDNVIPYAQSEILNKIWSNSEIYPTIGLGHNLILKNEMVINKVIEFINS